MSAIVQRVRAVPSWQVTLFVALLLLGFLIAAQLAVEGPRVRYTTQERTPLVETVLALQSQQEELKQQILDIRSRIQDLERQGRGSADLVRELNAELERARIAAGLIPLRGTGIVLQIEDSVQPVPAGDNAGDYLVSAADIRTVVEELWLAGAEAIAINGERITTTSALIDIGGSILVNSAYLSPPYQVAALGPAELWELVSARDGFADFFRARAEAYGIRISLAEPGEVDVPAFAGTVGLPFARIAPTASPAP